MSKSVSTVLVLSQNPNLFALKKTSKQPSIGVVGDTHLLAPSVNITGATQANPVVVTTMTAHGYSNGDNVFIHNVVGMIQLNGRSFVIGGVTTFTFQLVGVDGTGFTAYVSGGTVQKLL